MYYAIRQIYAEALSTWEKISQQPKLNKNLQNTNRTTQLLHFITKNHYHYTLNSQQSNAMVT